MLENHQFGSRQKPGQRVPVWVVRNDGYDDVCLSFFRSVCPSPSNPLLSSVLRSTSLKTCAQEIKIRTRTVPPRLYTVNIRDKIGSACNYVEPHDWERPERVFAKGVWSQTCSVFVHVSCADNQSSVAASLAGSPPVFGRTTPNIRQRPYIKSIEKSKAKSAVKSTAKLVA